MQNRVICLSRELEEAQEAIKEGTALEPVLRQRIEDLEDDMKDLTVNLHVLYVCWLSNILITIIVHSLGQITEKYRRTREKEEGADGSCGITKDSKTRTGSEKQSYPRAKGNCMIMTRNTVWFN